MPKYIAIAAITLDGKIAKGPKHFSNWTSEEDKLFMRALLDKCDVVIVGNNTYKTAIEPLSKRNCIVFSRTENQMNRIYVNPSKTDVKKLIRKLNYRKVAILGGAQTYTYCLKNKMLDELYLTIEPLVFGKGIDLFSSKKFLDSKFKLISSKLLNESGSLLLHYKNLQLQGIFGK
ncbi:MAG: dihydrofolate reductase [Candidatus Doudnabacteria bacterium]|nr:dihydrofolate reductase [Candidatus Doudnabacteria bacterium]